MDVFARGFGCSGSGLVVEGRGGFRIDLVRVTLDLVLCGLSSLSTVSTSLGRRSRGAEDLARGLMFARGLGSSETFLARRRRGFDESDEEEEETEERSSESDPLWSESEKSPMRGFRFDFLRSRSSCWP